MLGVFGDRLMYRLAYRNFGSYQDLVANHSVQVASGSNQTGIRWYELRNTGSGFTVHQQGTYAPDSNYRWMGSIAMDHAGDIAMGYNVSGATMSPTIRYAGRQATDALGTMESEVDVLSAAGAAHTSQTTSARWGDYSSIAVDPTDDCTFWYTNQYQTTTGSDHWSTQIVSFSFPACTGDGTVRWALVNKASNVGSPLASLSVPATGSGRLIAVALMFNGGTSVSSLSDNAGNTYVSAGARATNGAMSTEIWYAVNSKSEATAVTPRFAGSPTHVEMTEWEVSGIAPTAPDATGSAKGSVTTNNVSGPAVKTTQAGDFIVSVLFANTADLSSSAAGSAFTDDFTTFGNGWSHLASNSAGVGTYQAGWFTSAPSGIYCSSTAAFRAAQD
jgi:hypothetical protein